MPAVSLLQLGGYAPTTIPGLVRAIVDVYAAVAAKEQVAAPIIQFGRRYVEQIHAPPRIVIVPRRGLWGDLTQVGAGQITQMKPTIKAHIWGPEPTFTSDELENELARFDAADPLLARFLNVLNRVAVGRIEAVDVDPDADQDDPAGTNNYGETYVLSFRFIQDVARDERVFSVFPTLAASGQPTPQLSPAPIHAVDPTDFEVTPTVDPEE